MKIIFQIEGDLGINVVATAVCKAIKTQYPNCELIILTNHPSVFYCNPYIDKNLTGNELGYFYQTYVEGQDENKYFLLNPQFSSDFINEKQHLICIWCEMFGIKYNGELPELFINQLEGGFWSRHFVSEKPIMVIQTSSGEPKQTLKYVWTTDLPIATVQKVVNYFANHFQIYHIRHEDQLPLQNTIHVLQSDFRAIAVLISMSSKRLFIDSYCQQIATAFGLPSVVCWIGKKPIVMGYKMHTNIIANPPTFKPDLKNSKFSKYDNTGNLAEFCYNNQNEVFTTEKIIEALINQKECVLS